MYFDQIDSEIFIIQTISSSIILIFQFFHKSSLKILGLKCCFFVNFESLQWLNLIPLVLEFEKKEQIRKSKRGSFDYMVALNPLALNWLWIIALKKGGDIWNHYFPGKFQVVGGKFPGKKLEDYWNDKSNSFLHSLIYRDISKQIMEVLQIS